MDFEVLESLPPQERERFVGRCAERTYTRGQTILREGDPGEEFHLLKSGRVSLHITTSTGDVATLAVLRPGQAFGEIALVGHRPRSATVVALEAVTTLVMPLDLFAELRQCHPSVDPLLFDILASRVDRLSHELTEALYLPVEVRLARRLAQLAHAYRSGTEPVTIPMTQQEVAELVGATRSTVNGALNAMATDGVISIGRSRITILDASALNRLATGPASAT